MTRHNIAAVGAGKQYSFVTPLALALTTLAAFALRVFRLDAQSLWYDEGVTVEIARRGIAELTRWTANDIQPPLYYYIVSAWGRIAGWSEWSLRYPSVFFGTLIVPLLAAVTFALTRRKSAALLAALLAAVHPLLIYYSQEARMYATLIALGVLLAYLVVHISAGQRSQRMLWVAYRNRHPIMREIWRRYLHDELEGPQKWFAENSRPIEELYDTAADPYELTNLADDPQHLSVLERMRGALDDWRAEVGDLGVVDEWQMKRQWYPDGEQPQTDPVLFIPLAADADGVEPSKGGALMAPAAIQLYCSTQGASIAYTLDPKHTARWLLYTGPIRLPQGLTTIRAKAVRIGYADSPELSATFEVN